MSPNLLIITGATSVGKTATAVAVATKLGTEIVSADSMQVYRHLTIGTAKPTPAELDGVDYHLIDHVNPDEQYNLGRFLSEATPHIARLSRCAKLPVVCGGTGLYLRGLLYGVFETDSRSEAVRQQLDERVLLEGLPPLYHELMTVDPAATHIMPNDRQRILRALEVYYVTGKPITELQTQKDLKPHYQALTVVLTMPREEMYARINERVDAMVEQGLLEEVQTYLDLGYSEANPAIKALGYEELIKHVRDELSLSEALEVMKQKTRQYAKRQETWFRSMENTHIIPASGRSPGEVAQEICSLVG